jgi:transaldolase
MTSATQTLHDRGQSIYWHLNDSDRWQRLGELGARQQRLLWVSTSTKDPDAPDTLYVEGLAAPFTMNTMPDSTLEAFHDHGAVDVMSADGGDCDEVLARFAEVGIDVTGLAGQLQSDGAASFVSAWRDLMSRINAKSKALA